MKYKFNHFKLSYICLGLALFFLFVACDPKCEFIDSKFNLANESRLPKWFSVPTNHSRTDVTVTIATYSSWSGMKARVIARGPAPEYQVIFEGVGTLEIHPMTEQLGYDKYPLYSIVNINGIEEILEQQRPEDIVYISDDLKVIEYDKK